MCAKRFIALRTIAIALQLCHRHLHIILSNASQLHNFFQSPDDKIDADKVNYLHILFAESMVNDAQKTERNLMNKHRLYTPFSLRWSRRSEIENLRFEFNVSRLLVRLSSPFSCSRMPYSGKSILLKSDFLFPFISVLGSFVSLSRYRCSIRRSLIHFHFAHSRSLVYLANCLVFFFCHFTFSRSPFGLEKKIASNGVEGRDGETME